MTIWDHTIQSYLSQAIAVVIIIFRLPDLLTGENVMCNRLNLYKYDNRYKENIDSPSFFLKLSKQFNLQPVDKPGLYGKKLRFRFDVKS